MIRIGIFGATGYTGFELINIIKNHPAVQLVFATSESAAGQLLSDIYAVPWVIPLIPAANAPLDRVEVAFCCLPHGASMPAVIAARQAGVRVIDLSADFRLSDPDLYTNWYNLPHQAPELLTEAVYGLPEIYAAQIQNTNLLANPGCYPTSVLLGLYPLLRTNLLNSQVPLIADSKSGVSGAGRKATLKTHFVEANENLSPYNIGRTHRHMAEMEQIINRLGGPADQLIFAPHLVPVSRGMLSTIYVSITDDISLAEMYDLYAQTYANDPLIWLLLPGQPVTMAHTRQTNLCAISISPVTERQYIICSSIDNLGKGAAGQAMQNFNIMCGLKQTIGLL